MAEKSNESTNVVNNKYKKKWLVTAAVKEKLAEAQRKKLDAQNVESGGVSQTGSGNPNATGSSVAVAAAAPVVVPASNNISTQGLALNPFIRSIIAGDKNNVTVDNKNIAVNDTRPRSSNLIGGEIKVDEDGRMSLKEIEKKNFLEQLFRGSVVPTEQITGIIKDVAYGVDSKDQRTMESGLDLILNPLIKPFVDPRMKEHGIITDEYYWPEELKLDWNVLPEFMQKGSGEDYKPETRTFLQGAQANVGNIGAVLTDGYVAGHIRDEEFKISAERFERAPGYYIGSALGEIPYFLIGGGQIKAVATISAKSTAGIIRGTVRGTAGVKLIARAYKIEEGARKAQLALDKQTQSLGKTTKFVAKKQIVKTIELLKHGYSDNIDVARKAIADNKVEGVMADMTRETAAKAEQNSIGLNKFKNDMDRVEQLPETTEFEIAEKMQQVELVTREIQEELMPQVRAFKNQFLAETIKISTGSKAEKLARFIQGSPGDVSTKLDNFFNKPGKTFGDSAYKQDVTFRNVLKNRYLQRERAGEFAGVFGSLKLDRELYGNVLSSALGINRATAKMTDLAGLVSRTVNVTKTLKVGDVDKIKSSMDDDITRLQSENDLLESFKLRAGTGEKMTKREIDAQISDDVLDKGQTLEERIAINTEKVDALYTAKEESFTPYYTGLNFKVGNIQKEARDAVGNRIGKEGTTQKVFNYDALAEAYPDAAKRFQEQSLQVAVRPTVNVRKSHGIIHGTIGDDPKTSMSFWLTNMDHKKAATTFGSTYISDSSIWKQIGLKKLNTPIGKYQTIMPWKATQQEQILTIYQASDNAQFAGRSKSGVRPNVIMNANAKEEIELLQSAGFLEKRSDSAFSTEEIMLGGGPDGNKKVFQYSEIEDAKIKQAMDDANPEGNYKTGETKVYDPIGWNDSRNPSPLATTPTVNAVSNRVGNVRPMFGADNPREVNRVLLQRAMIENRLDSVKGFAETLTEQYKGHKLFTSQKYKDEIMKLKKKETTNKDSMGYNYNNPDAVNKKGKELTIQHDKDQLEIDLDIYQLEKITKKSPEDLQKSLKKLDINATGVPHGTLTHVPVERLRQFDAEYKAINETGVVKEDLTNLGDFYYDSGTDIFKVKNIDNFNPGMVMLSDNVVQTKNMFEPTGGGPMLKSPTSIIENKKQTRGQMQDYEVPVLKLGNDEYMPSIDSDVVYGLNRNASAGFINLSEESSYGNFLTKMTSEEAGKLRYGNLWEITDSTNKSINKVKTGSPDISTAVTATGALINRSQTTLPQRVSQQLQVNTLKIARDKLFKSFNTKNSIQSFFTGPRFRNVDTSSLKPDNPSDTIFKNNRLTGFTEFNTLFNIDASLGIVQRNTPGGVKSNPIYEMLDVHHLRIEREMDEVDAMRTAPLKPAKGNNYRLLEEAVRLKTQGEVKDSVPGFSRGMLVFREKMVELVQGKINKNTGKFKSATVSEIAADPAMYKSVVLDVVDRPDNKYVRLPTRKDWLKKGTNRYRYINPSHDFPELANVIPNRGFFGNLRTQWKSQLIPVRPEKGSTIGTETSLNDDFSANIFNRVTKNLVERTGAIDSISSESLSPYFNESYNKIILTFDRDKLPRNFRGDRDRAKREGIRATDKADQAVEAYQLREEVRARQWNTSKENKARAYESEEVKLTKDEMGYTKSSLTKDEKDKANALYTHSENAEIYYKGKISPLEKENELLQNNLDTGVWFKTRPDPDDPTKTISKRMEMSETQIKKQTSKVKSNKKKIEKVKNEKENDQVLKDVYAKINKLKKADKWKDEPVYIKFSDNEIKAKLDELKNNNKIAAQNVRSEKFVISRKLTAEEGNAGTADILPGGNTFFNISLDGKRLSPTSMNVLGFTLNPAPLSRAQTEAMVKGLFESKIGVTDISRADDPARIEVNTRIIGMFDSVLSRSEVNKATGSKSGMGSFLNSPKGYMLMNTPSMQNALSQQLALAASTSKMSAKTLAKESNKLPRSIQAFSPEYITANLAQAQKAEQKTIGFGRQAAINAPLATSVASSPSLRQETEYAIPSLLPGPQASFGEPPPNMLEQTMGDIQTTIKGINVGNKSISENQSTQVKTYELPKGMEASTTIKSMSTAIGDLSTNTKDTFGKILMSPKQLTEMNTNVSTQQGQGLLAGMNLDVFKVGAASESVTQSRSTTDTLTLLSLGYKAKTAPKMKQASGLAQLSAFKVQDRIFPKEIMQQKVKQLKTGKLIPQRIFPVIPLIGRSPPRGRDSRRGYYRKPRIKDKTWWQTPENWYEPYYWGGKNQTGAGYVKFRGKEPGKVKKYEKKHFGIGVNDAPFGIKGSGF